MSLRTNIAFHTRITAIEAGILDSGSPGSQHLVRGLKQLGFSFKDGRGWWRK
jgi:hypothetical protein